MVQEEQTVEEAPVSESEKSDIENIEYKNNTFTAVYTPTNESRVFSSYTEAAGWIGSKYKTKQETTAPKTGTPAPTTGNPFTELESTKGLKGTAKTKAVKALKQKYGPDYNRISKIDTNFASIVRDLEKNNLIEKDCG